MGGDHDIGERETEAIGDRLDGHFLSRAKPLGSGDLGADRTRRPKRSRPARRPRSSSSSKSASSLKAEPTLTIARAGTVYASDGGTEIATPHDNCVLIMPTRHPKRGETAVRLGRYID